MKRQTRRSARSGLASIWGLVVLSTLAIITAGVTSQLAAARRSIEMRDNRIRAEWLARSGIELAIDKLLDDENGYSGETTRLTPEGEISIVVSKTAKGRHIEVDAMYPLEGRTRAKVKITRDVQRLESNGRVKIKVIDD